MVAILWNRQTGLVQRMEHQPRTSSYRILVPVNEPISMIPRADDPPFTVSFPKYREFEFWSEMCGVDLYLEKE
jgi:hypothetical protein